jgi:excisionase family DNA binding protein
MALLTIKEAAEALDVHENTIRNWVKNGLLRSYRLNPTGRIFINETDIRKVLKSFEKWRQRDED